MMLLEVASMAAAPNLKSAGLRKNNSWKVYVSLLAFVLNEEEAMICCRIKQKPTRHRSTLGCKVISPIERGIEFRYVQFRGGSQPCPKSWAGKLCT